MSTGTWLAEKCDQRRSAASGRVREARNLAHMPETVSAAEAGDLSRAKVELLARARKERLADEFDRMEPTLVAEAKRLSADGLARLLKRWEHLARDAVQAEPDAGPGGDDRPSEIHLSQTFGGRWSLSGDLTAEDGAILASGISHTTDVLFHAGAATADGVLLTPSQRRGRATVEVFRRGMTADPRAARRPPARPGPGRLRAAGGTGPERTVAGGRGSLAISGPAPPRHAMRWWGAVRERPMCARCRRDRSPRATAQTRRRSVPVMHRIRSRCDPTNATTTRAPPPISAETASSTRAAPRPPPRSAAARHVRDRRCRSGVDGDDPATRLRRGHPAGDRRRPQRGARRRPGPPACHACPAGRPTGPGSGLCVPRL